jgi:hypothetical protein
MRYNAKVKGQETVVVLTKFAISSKRRINEYGTRLSKTMKSESVPKLFLPVFVSVRTKIRADRDEHSELFIYGLMGTYFITSWKWFWNAEPSGPGIFFKGSKDGMINNILKSQTKPLASKSKRNTAAILAINIDRLRKVPAMVSSEGEG